MKKTEVPVKTEADESRPEGAQSDGVLQGGSGSMDNPDGRRSRAQEDSGGILMVKQGARELQDCRAAENNVCSAVEGSDSTESSQEVLDQSAVQCSLSQNSISQHCKDAVTPDSSCRNVNSSCSLHAVRPRCNRRLSFADQLRSDRRTDRCDTVADVCINTSAVLDINS